MTKDEDQCISITRSFWGDLVGNLHISVIPRKGLVRQIYIWYVIISTTGIIRRI